MKITWQSPSNLALIKYWGKHGRQLPNNASISLTLDQAYTVTSLEYEEKEDNGKIELDFHFEQKTNPAFGKRIQKFLESILDELPFLTQYKLRINSHNSFPHSAGIASSASSMSALALCLQSMRQLVSIGLPNEEHFYKEASNFARLGSGSASRSVYPYVAVWGQTSHIPAAHNEYAIPYADQVDQVFRSFHDDILIVSKKEKSVSSSAGHDLMNGNPFADIRYQQAHENMGKLLEAMHVGDLKTFGEITEAEALMLHALMMTSDPSYILMEGSSLEVIKRVQAWRKSTKKPLYFSLDAGPNLHLLYPDEIEKEVDAFIQNDLIQFCEDGRYLKDQVGAGPQKL